MSNDTITIDTPMLTRDMKRLVFNGQERDISIGCTHMVFEVTPGDIPSLTIEYAPGDKTKPPDTPKPPPKRIINEDVI